MSPYWLCPIAILLATVLVTAALMLSGVISERERREESQERTL